LLLCRAPRVSDAAWPPSNMRDQFGVKRNCAQPHPVLSLMDEGELITKMRARVEQCRRLADMTHNREMRETLLQMASDGEADIRKLEAQQAS
jgi:hypothetical protein